MRPTEIDSRQYDAQLADKANQLRGLFEHHNMPPLELYPSASLHYRMRAEFRVWHDGEDLYHIMFDSQTKEKYRVNHFPPASQLINDVMGDLLELLKPNDTLRRKLYQIDYLSTLSGEILVTLVYHKPLDEEWQQEAQKLRDILRNKYCLDLVGRSRKQMVLLERDHVIEALNINGRTYQFKQIENSFTQPNAQVNCKMIEWALDATRNLNGDLLELYCGLGNFTLPLAQNFERVLATEISKASVEAANYNAKLNHIDNVTVIRISSEEFTEALQGKRQFRRLEGIQLEDFDCQTVLVDPPRAGLDPDTCELVSHYPNILYISCNPQTLLDNLDTLGQTHEVTRFALFDQFPYTHHAECGVVLRKRA
ncbi:tRNA (uridine(54)-C5)-methyltransferase TrmA [Bowmanella sp. Y26]|uniref:tRNA (uridine(54)-C5)-methyltransferase TrmA n=1 Tax=Bowmanella yangjiangensis TaxID=2811230 RepID=UPI001BDC9FB3|nr:tRNA (uridine(54)-C5)-methyltransferase TrmA [Bowmanella yangjiangensis]MBT1066127.1 tRNA (uridine(54)-C5)-methyltransferase TrmA [Bowmanella yangjiangensis]